MILVFSAADYAVSFPPSPSLSFVSRVSSPFHKDDCDCDDSSAGAGRQAQEGEEDDDCQRCLEDIYERRPIRVVPSCVNGARAVHAT